MTEAEIERMYLKRFGVRLEPGMRRYVVDRLRTGQAVPGLTDSLIAMGDQTPVAIPLSAAPLVGLSEPPEDFSEPS